jgi:hypothetical protein
MHRFEFLFLQNVRHSKDFQPIDFDANRTIFCIYNNKSLPGKFDRNFSHKKLFRKMILDMQVMYHCLVREFTVIFIFHYRGTYLFIISSDILVCIQIYTLLLPIFR